MPESARWQSDGAKWGQMVLEGSQKIPDGARWSIYKSLKKV
jgi:hypothetical protein